MTAGRRIVASLIVALTAGAFAASPGDAARLEVVVGHGSVADGGAEEVRGARARAAAVDDSCRNGEFDLSGFPAGPAWAPRGYTYRANLSRMPHGDRDRRQITKGKHTWDNTRNGCGYKDVASFRTV